MRIAIFNEIPFEDASRETREDFRAENPGSISGVRLLCAHSPNSLANPSRRFERLQKMSADINATAVQSKEIYFSIPRSIASSGDKGSWVDGFNKIVA